MSRGVLFALQLDWMWTRRDQLSLGLAIIERKRAGVDEGNAALDVSLSSQRSNKPCQAGTQALSATVPLWAKRTGI